MKKFFTLITVMLLTTAAHAAQYSEGKQYRVLNTQASAQPEVSEYFSFYCPHCYNFEPIIEQVKNSLPENTKFQKIHPSFMGGSMGVSMAKAYATMTVLEIEDKMIPVMFRQIHELKRAPKNDQALRQLFIDHGVAGKDFDAAFNSFVVGSMQSRFNQAFKNAGLRSVPSVVVNNKYLITPDESINSIDKYIQLINFLLKK